MTDHPPLGTTETNLIGETMTKFTKEQQKVLEDVINFDGKKVDILNKFTRNYCLRSVWGSVWGSVEGNVYGSVKGDVRGDVWGSVWGSVKGDVVGNVYKNATGSVKGNVK